jgi:hypothetical protein
MEKVIHKLINEFTEGVDTYTYNGSTWLIFTESKEWVIELTDSKTLWYNYNFFKSVFSYTSMDVVDNQQYITKWVEDNFINEVKDTILEINITEGEVDDIIQDGVKLTQFNDNENKSWVEGVIENGVKETMFNQGHKQLTVKNIIKNSVRHTLNTEYMPTSMVEDIIQSGVKHTEYGDWLDGDERLDDIIENGVKETKQKKNAFLVLDTSGRELILESHLVIRDGVKETKTPGKDGDIMSTVEWMNENNSSSYTKMINDVLDNGEKINGTYSGGQRQSEKCKSVVEYGIKTKTPGCPGV